MESKPRVLGNGPFPSPRLMVVGEAPAEEEVKKKKPFVGRTGMELDNYLRRFGGIKREECYVTNIFKWPLDEKKKVKFTPDEWVDASRELEEEIERVRPQIILSLGVHSTRFFIPDMPDIEAVNGVPHNWRGRIVVPSIHPAAGFHDPAVMQWVKEAFEMLGDVLNGDDDTIIISPLEFYPPEEIGSLPSTSLISLDTESLITNTPYMIQAATTPKHVSLCYVNTVEASGWLMEVGRRVKERGVTTLLHNALYDLPILWRLGIFPRTFIDTMHVAFLLQTLPMGLKSLSYHLLGRVMKEYAEVVGEYPDLSYVPVRPREEYACGDPIATLRVHEAMKYMWYEGMEEVLARDHDIMPMVIGMMDRGMKIDKKFLSDLEGDLIVRNLNLLEEIRGEVGDPEFNPKSAQQLSQLLYTKMGLGKGMRIKRTKWGGTTDKNALKRIQGESPIVKKIGEYKETETLISNYTSVLPKLAQSDGRIHTKISMIRVKHSGRLASSNPNLLAQPTRSEDGKKIRKGFVAEDGYVYVSFDYSQIEMRLMAHESQDPVMLKLFREGKDLHTMTAAMMFGIKEEDVDEMRHRYPAKRTGFGIIYGISAQGLARELMAEAPGLWNEDLCQRMLDEWFRVYRGVKVYMQNVHAEVRRYGRISDMWGRMTYIPGVWSVFENTKEEALRLAVNQKIQGGAQGIIKEAMRGMVKVGKMWVKEGKAYPLLQIHDDIMAEVREEFVPEYIPTVRRLMEGAVTLSLPVLVEPKCGPRWGDMRKYEG